MAVTRVYWDSSVFHALFSKEAGRVEKCQRIEQAAQKGLVEIYFSSVSYTECVWLKSVERRLSKEHEEVIQKYFQHKFLKPVTCERSIGEEARQLLWRYAHLKPKDAIHVASALFARVDAMHSYDDDDLVKISGQIGDPPLRICHPGDESDFALAIEKTHST